MLFVNQSKPLVSGLACGSHAAVEPIAPLLFPRLLQAAFVILVPGHASFQQVLVRNIDLSRGTFPILSRIHRKATTTCALRFISLKPNPQQKRSCWFLAFGHHSEDSKSSFATFEVLTKNDTRRAKKVKPLHTNKNAQTQRGNEPLGSSLPWCNPKWKTLPTLHTHTHTLTHTHNHTHPGSHLLLDLPRLDHRREILLISLRVEG